VTALVVKDWRYRDCSRAALAKVLGAEATRDHPRVPRNLLQREAICCVFRVTAGCRLPFYLLTGQGFGCPLPNYPAARTRNAHRGPELDSSVGCGDLASRLAAPALLRGLPQRAGVPNIGTPINLRH
jgi:hypothetical protein